MTRAIVHKTKGKLDLRAFTVFGLNSKPATDTPIGYFGTGLKYAIAVLARHHIYPTFWIGGKKWTIEDEFTTFRDKRFQSLFLKRETLVPKRIPLPFTTELGKNWELWQAFRELESNTRDEKGITYLRESEPSASYVKSLGEAGWTLIYIEDSDYVQCWLDRDKVFLPEGLTQSSGTERVQAFKYKSSSVYYRSIRIMDLEKESENTYNILTPVELTEDRTAKNAWNVNYEIQKFLVGTKDKEVVRRAVVAPAHSYERQLSYDYTSRSETFLDTVQEAGEDATDAARAILRADRPLKPPTEEFTNWIFNLADAVDKGDYDRVEQVSRDNKLELLNLLRFAAQTKAKEDSNNSQIETYASTARLEPAGSITDRFASAHIEEVNKDDDIPF
jgi:hypothetical protein